MGEEVMKGGGGNQGKEKGGERGRGRKKKKLDKNWREKEGWKEEEEVRKGGGSSTKNCCPSFASSSYQGSSSHHDPYEGSFHQNYPYGGPDQYFSSPDSRSYQGGGWKPNKIFPSFGRGGKKKMREKEEDNHGKRCKITNWLTFF